MTEKIKFLFHGVTCGNAVFARSKINLLILILAFYMTKCFHIVNGKHFRNFVGERAGRAAKLLATLASAKKNGTLEGDTRPAHAPPTPRAQKKGEEKERKDI